MTPEMYLGIAIGVVGTIVSWMTSVVATDWWRRIRPW